MYFSLPGTAMRESEPKKIAAVAESAATTKWREEPNIENATSASSTVYPAGPASMLYIRAVSDRRRRAQSRHPLWG